MLRRVTHGALKQMGRDLLRAKVELKSGKKTLDQLSRRAEGAFMNWPWPVSGITTRDCTTEDMSTEYEDEFPLAVVSRSVNNILKSSYRKIDEQVEETERVRATVSGLREELDETSIACDGALEEVEKQARQVEDLRNECCSLREMVHTLERFKEVVGAGERVADAEYREALDRLGRLEQELEVHRYKGALFDGLCQEVRMLPYSLRSVEAAGRCLDGLRAWVKAKEGQLLERCGGANGVGASEDAETSFTSCGSPVPASSASGEFVSGEQY